MKNFLKNFSFMGFLMLMLCVLLGVGDMSGAICANGTTALTPEGTGEAVTSTPKEGGLTADDIRQNANKNIADIIHDPIDQKIVQIRPYANPIDTLLRYANADTINNLEFEWYSIGTRPVFDTLNGNAIVNTSSDPTGVYVKFKVTKMSLFDVTDTLAVTADNGSELQLYIYKKDSDYLYANCDESMYVKSGDNYTIPAISSGTKVYAMGRSASEKDVVTPALTFLPQKKRGYCQIFMAEIETNTYEQMADKEIPWNLSEVEENVMFEYRRRMEGTWLRGKQGKVYDPEKKRYIYATAGLLSQIAKTHYIDADAADGNAEMVEFSKKVFKGNNGARTRFAIAGSDALSDLSKLQGIDRRQDAVQTEVVYGITWNKIVTNFGQINVVLHEQLDEYGLSDKMIVVDPQFLKMKRVKGFERNQVNGKEHLITNGDIITFSESVGLAVYNPDVHCIVTVGHGAQS